MGSLLSRRKEKAKDEVLAELSESIGSVQNEKSYNAQLQDRLFNRFLLWSVLFHGLVASYFYLCLGSPSTRQKVAFYTGNIVCFVIAYYIYKLVRFYYKRKLERSNMCIDVMLESRKKLVDEIKETLPYRKAKDVLVKYAPEDLKEEFKELFPDEPPLSRNASIASESMNAAGNGGPALNNTQQLLSPSMRPQLVRPILPPVRTRVDRLMDWLTGDGVTNRGALICVYCFNHNGMCLLEERISFNCCYCGHFNQAALQPDLEPNAAAELNEDSFNPDGAAAAITQTETTDAPNTDNEQAAAVETET